MICAAEFKARYCKGSPAALERKCSSSGLQLPDMLSTASRLMYLLLVMMVVTESRPAVVALSTNNLHVRLLSHRVDHTSQFGLIHSARSFNCVFSFDQSLWFRDTTDAVDNSTSLQAL